MRGLQTRVVGRQFLLCTVAWILGLTCVRDANAAFVGLYALSNFTVSQTDPTDGSSVMSPDGGLSVVLTGGNNGSGNPSEIDWFITAPATGLVTFHWSYSSLDTPGFDGGGFLQGGSNVFLSVADGESNTESINIFAGQKFGFFAATMDNQGEPGILTISDFNGPTPVPEPGTALQLIGTALIALCMYWVKSGNRYRLCGLATLLLTVGSAVLLAQPRNFTPVDISGQIQLTGRTNLHALATASATAVTSSSNQLYFAQEQIRNFSTESAQPPEQGKLIPLLRLPQLTRPTPLSGSQPRSSQARTSSLRQALMAPATTQSLAVVPAGSFGFDGMTHRDQRFANNGNQFSVEPPNPSIAVANGFVLEGVNNAVQVYTTNGTPQLPIVLSSNQVFGLPPALNRATGANGVFPTDMHVFHDQSINRWFIVQRAQDNDISGNPLPSSHLYIAVSQTDDPTQNYNIYTMDSTNSSNFGCPCIFDYPQLGADQNAFYISGNEFTPFFTFVDAAILAISKASLSAGVQSPRTVRFLIPLSSGFEFAIQPAVTPPGGSYFVAGVSQGGAGIEYFTSSQGQFGFDSNLAVWAMFNTSFIDNPAMTGLIGLTELLIPTTSYTVPDVANQKPGPPGSRPLGEGMNPPGPLELIDGGDARVQSTSYVSGRLWVTLATELLDNTGNRVIGTAYFILSPTYRAGVLSASVLRQGYLNVPGNHLLRPAWAINAQGTGVLVSTLVGPSYFPSTALIPLNLTSTPSSVQISGMGVSPEDGFTGYPGNGARGIARWGDTSSAVVDSSGTLWLAGEYISSAPRSPTANWATFITRYITQ